MGGEFPALLAPSTRSVESIEINDFLTAMHGPAATGIESGEDPSAFRSPRLMTVDCRSPAEFENGHIPGAVNIPLFSNETREVIGTCYSQRGRFDAIRLGLEHTGPAFSNLIDQLTGYGAKEGDSVLVYCWRGGMRSGSVAWLFSLCGFAVRTLLGGYRSYRRWCKDTVGNAHAPAPAPIVVVGGCTGVGKTAVLLDLRRRGEQVIDLEALANHRGSAFGSIGQAPQPTNEAYENVLAMAFRRLCSQRPIWLEHEGNHVGKVLVPFGIHTWVRQAPGACFIVLELPRELRVRRLVEDYCSETNLQTLGWVEDLKTCISSGLAKKLGGNRVKDALKLLDEQKWTEVADMMLSYYDKLYLRWGEQNESISKLTVDCSSEDATNNAASVLKTWRQFQPGSSNTDCGDRECAGVEQIRGRERVCVDECGGVERGGELPAPLASTFCGKCFCGEVSVACVGEPRSVSYCHCSICRRLSGAPFSCQALFSSEQVHVSFEAGGGLQPMRTSRGVERNRCASCMSPVQATLFGGKVIAVPLGLLTEWRGVAKAVNSCGGSEKAKPALMPRHHLYYNNRVMDVIDGLPKYAGALVGNNKSAEGSKGLLPEADW